MTPGVSVHYHVLTSQALNIANTGLGAVKMEKQTLKHSSLLLK